MRTGSLFSFLFLLFLLSVMMTVECKRRRRVASSVVYSWKVDATRKPVAKVIDLVSSFFHEINITRITAGMSHSVALSQELGTVFTWGNNDSGQLGDETSIGRTLPAPMYSVRENPISVVQLTSGHNHMLMLTNDGKLYACGLNDNGQLGNGDTTFASKNIPVPVDMDGALSGTLITQMAAGDFHSLALTSDGRIFAWGRNSEGQLGNPDRMFTTATVPVAMDMLPLDGKLITQIAAGMSCSVALASDGTVYWWGHITVGQQYMDAGSPTAIDLSNVSQGRIVTQISVGYKHVVMLTNDSMLYSWGSGEHGQLGNGDTKNSVVPVAVDMEKLSGKVVVRIETGGYHTLALTSDGLLYGWGNNQRGQLDSSTADNYYRPVLLEISSTLTDSITQVAAGEAHTMILTSKGKSYSWGGNEDGQLGNGRKEVKSNTASAIGMSGALSGKTITKIEARIEVWEKLKTEQFGTLTEDGSIVTWGTNSKGEVGDGTAITKPFPVSVGISGVLKEWIITQITLGHHFTAARADDGTLYSWGNNRSGELGDGSNQSRRQPVAVLFMDGLLRNQTITAVFAGRWSAFAIANNGQMYAWGYNNYGTLGDGTTQNKKLPVSVVMDNLADKTVVQVASAYFHTVALTSDGALYAWGVNTCGLLKNEDSSVLPHKVEMNNHLSARRITHITAGREHTTVLTSDGRIYSWGLVDFGAPISVDNFPVQVSMNGLLNNGKVVSQFVVNDVYLLALTNDGELGYWDFEGNYSTWVSVSNVDSEQSITSLFIGLNSMGFLGVKCEPGFYGQDCERFDCHGTEAKDKRRVCSGNGACVDLDTCECKEGYTGMNCSYPMCNGYSSIDNNVCSSHGKCQSPNRCICTYGYHGDTCSSNLKPLWTLPVLGMFLCVSLIITIFVVGLQMRRKRREEQMKSELRACLLEEMGEHNYSGIEKGDFYIGMKEVKLISRISEGAFGIVFKGEWKSNLVAVKKMKISDDESFIKEVAILQSLRHPNILYLYGYSSNDSGDKFLITEYAVNGSLDKVIHKANPLLKAFDQKMSILCQIADTMAYLHGRSPRIVHRDLKPQNILLGENYHVRICDFGLSKITDSSFTQGRSYGTIEYCAPELLAHQVHDEKCDVYSFGIIMHEMFILAPPYSQHTYSSVFTLGMDIVRGLRPLQFDTISNDSQTLTDFFLQSNTANISQTDIHRVVTEFYSLAARCWDADTTKRPSFEEITMELETLKQRSEKK